MNPERREPRHHVLIVDDSPSNLTTLAELLRAHYLVRVATSGERALKALTPGPLPDIILLDILMPGMDGYQVLQRLQADPALRAIPVIFLTALNAEADELHGLDCGAVDYITKPFNPAIVLARLRTQIELKEARDRLAGENARLDAEVSRRMHENVLIQDLSIRALANLAETRDMETGRHVLRTQAYVELLARRLQDHPRFREALAGPRLAQVVKAAPLHDMGKVGIPDAVLLKPGRLDAAEFDIMKTHAAIGAQAIGKAMDDTRSASSAAATVPGAFDFMHIAQQIALTHHEHWDGSGYPAGLAGEAIPAAGRLMALADVYDALSCRRIYKPAFSLEVAAHEVIAGRGVQFDPDVVDAFIALRPQFEAVALRFADPDESRVPDVLHVGAVADRA